jgi:hypothetical protein
MGNNNCFAENANKYCYLNRREIEIKPTICQIKKIVIINHTTNTYVLEYFENDKCYKIIHPKCKTTIFCSQFEGEKNILVFRKGNIHRICKKLPTVIICDINEASQYYGDGLIIVFN